MSWHKAWSWTVTGARALALGMVGLTQWLPGAVFASVAALTVALWLWAGTAGSLRQALAVATPFAPALASLEWSELDATLRDGGQARQLTWQQEGLTVVMEQPRFAWQFLPLLLGQPLALELQAQTVRVTDLRPADTEPATPPETLSLPLSVALDFDLGPLYWDAQAQRQSPARVQRLRGRYTHDETADGDDAHHLHLAELVAAQGQYEGEVQVSTEPPFVVTGQLRGNLASTATPRWQAKLAASLMGELAGPQATLALDVRLDSPAPGPKADLQATLQPWHSQPLIRLNARLHRLDLASLWGGLPYTQLSGEAQGGPAEGAHPRWRVATQLQNTAPGTWDNGRIPFTQMDLEAQGNASAGDITQFKVRAGGGQIEGSGRWQGHLWQGLLRAEGVRLDDIDTRLPPALFNATLQARQHTDAHHRATTSATLDATAHVLSNTKKWDSKLYIPIKRQASISSKFSWDGQRLDLTQLVAGLDDARLEAQGTLTPAQPGWNGDVNLTAPGLQLSTQGQIAPGTGQGQLIARLDNGNALARWLSSLPGAGQALGLVASQPLPDARGTAHLAWQGGWQDPALRLDTEVSLSQFSVPAVANRPAVSGQAVQLALAGTAARWDARASGQLLNHALQADVTLAVSGQTPDTSTGRLDITQFKATLAPRQGASALEVRAPQRLGVAWRAGVASLDPGALHFMPLQPAAATSSPAVVDWQASTLGAKGLNTSGQFSGLGVQRWSQLLSQLGSPVMANALDAAGLGGNLALQGQWQLDWPNMLTEAPRGHLRVFRESGDLQVDDASRSTLAEPGATQVRPQALALGLTQAAIELRLQNDALNLTTQWDSLRAGHVHGEWTTPLTPGPHTSAKGWMPQPGASLSGQAQAHWPDIAVWSRLVPPGWRLKGQLGLSVTTAGKLDRPEWRGELRADDLELRSVVEGLAFGRGTLRATLDGDHMDITAFRLEGDGGAATGGLLQLTGSARWPASGEGSDMGTVELQATAQRLRVSARADRRLTVSGQTTARLSQKLLTLRGKLKADQAQFLLPDETTPTTGSDVVVRMTRAAPAQPATTPLRTDVALQIDLGPQFEIQGQGLQTRLSGELTVTSAPASDTFRVLGEVRAVNGTYRAYGQPLRIEDGVLRFSGPYDDPGLDVLALRGKSGPGSQSRLSASASETQQVGVKITGSARAPRVALYASPELPDSEKLAWLVLGRPASGVGAETAVLQQAALALLADNNGRGIDANLASALGLDDISLRGDTTQGTDGSTTQSTALSLGKRLSSKLYVTYEHSLNSAMGALNLYYDVSRRLTIRAQAGHESALDLIITLQND